MTNPVGGTSSGGCSTGSWQLRDRVSTASLEAPGTSARRPRRPGRDRRVGVGRGAERAHAGSRSNGHICGAARAAGRSVEGHRHPPASATELGVATEPIESDGPRHHRCRSGERVGGCCLATFCPSRARQIERSGARREREPTAPHDLHATSTTTEPAIGAAPDGDHSAESVTTPRREPRRRPYRATMALGRAGSRTVSAKPLVVVIRLYAIG
jgi:hypothetical protein